MTNEPYLLAIVALLPLTATMVVTQVNPYYALVMRGILGAVAALVYALLGAADVALTEALVGTMLSITLYAIAVRSSLSVRIGVISADLEFDTPALYKSLPWLKDALHKHHMRAEVVRYDSPETLKTAIAAKDIHAIYAPTADDAADPLTPSGEANHHLQIRVEQVYSILKAELPPAVILSYGTEV